MIVSYFTGIEAPEIDLIPCAVSCDSPDCYGCAAEECPHGEPLHRDKDGCPACDDWTTAEDADSPLVSACLDGWARCPYPVVGGPVVEVRSWR